MEILNKLIKRITYPFKLRAMRKGMSKWVEADKVIEKTREERRKKRESEPFNFGVPDMTGMVLLFAMAGNKELSDEINETAKAWGVLVRDLPMSWKKCKMMEHNEKRKELSTDGPRLEMKSLKSRTSPVPEGVTVSMFQPGIHFPEIKNKDTTILDLINKSRNDSLKRILENHNTPVDQLGTHCSSRPKINVGSPLVSDVQEIAMQLAQHGDPKELVEVLFQNIKE